jgi:hypothetical protein
MRAAVILALIGAIGFGIAKYGVPKYQEEKQKRAVVETKARLTATVARENEKLPRKVLKNARIDSVEYENDTLTYKYFVLGDPYTFIGNRDEFEKSMGNVVCKGEGSAIAGDAMDAKELKEFAAALALLKVTSVFAFRFNPPSGASMTVEVTFTPERCKAMQA